MPQETSNNNNNNNNNIEITQNEVLRAYFATHRDTLAVYVLEFITFPISVIAIPAVAGGLLELIKDGKPLSTMKKPVLIVLSLIFGLALCKVLVVHHHASNVADFKVYVRNLIMRYVVEARAYRYRSVDVPSVITQLNVIPSALYATVHQISSSLLPNVSTLLGTLGFMLWVSHKADDPWIGATMIVTTACVAATFLVTTKYCIPGFRASGEMAEANYDRSGDMLEVLEHTLAVDAREEEGARARVADEAYTDTFDRVNGNAALLSNLSGAITMGGLIVTVLFSWRAVREKRMDMALFNSVLFVSMSTHGILTNLSMSMPTVVRDYAQAARLVNNLNDLRREGELSNSVARDAIPTLSADAACPAAAVTVRFENVTFAYPRFNASATAPATVLEDVTFTLPAGARVLVSGVVGSGKSTIGLLLLGLQAESAGSVSVCGHRIQSLSRKSIMRLVSLIPAAPHLLKRTVRENMLYGLADRDFTDAQLLDALARVGITNIPLSRRVGKLGELLSTGQRKLVYLAKALLQDTPVVIADEITANLDPQTAATVLGALHRNISSSKILVYISHDTRAAVAFTHALTVANKRVALTSL
jgi:ABC-type multidrug transport system fused ATPase/permease subunit